jgi:phosphoenolpyruvate-protein phosphotransferase (PTS system enzyme I)
MPTGTRICGQVFRGIGVSPGVAYGPAMLVLPETVNVFERPIEAHAVAAEIARLEEALIDTRQQIRDIQGTLRGQTHSHDASIFDAHLMVLDDRTFLDEIISGVRERKRNIEFAVQEGTEKYASVLAAVNDDYLRERVADVRDVGKRILQNLTGRPLEKRIQIDNPHLIVAHDLSPSETASMAGEQILGFATDLGSPTSHTAVMARALSIPAVVGMHSISARICADDHVLIDGNKGVLIINPSEEQLQMYGEMAEARKTIEVELKRLQKEPAITRDGRSIVLSANIESANEIKAVQDSGAQGVGLLRSEFIHLMQNRMLDEDEQFSIYHKIAQALAPEPVIIRTLDIGGDKCFFGVQPFLEENPFLGLRSIRLCLRYPDYFRQQLRAILRASAVGNVRLMYPMISGLSELEQADACLADVKRELDAEGIAYDRNIQRGIMIEVPSAALIADKLAPKVDFFSIGTNDLIQYTIAVDRRNERVAYLYEPTHPAVLRLIRMTVDAAHANGIWAGVCGQMASDPLMTPILLGLGVDELSVSPDAVPMIKDAVRALSHAETQAFATNALEDASMGEIRDKSRQIILAAAPELNDWLS